MITDKILNAFFGGINALLSLMPSFTMPTFGGATLLGQTVSQFEPIFPVGTVFAVIAAALVLRLALSAWDFIAFVYHQFWGAS